MPNMYGRARGGTARTETGSSPADSAVAVTTSDTVDLVAGEARGIYVGVGGDVTCMVEQVAILFKNVQTGAILPVRTTRVNATNTTATNMVALY